MSFTDSDEDKLISIVAQYPALYDTSHQSYRDAFVKDNVWETVANMLQKSTDDCKKKWKFIRDSYQRYMKKNKHKIAAGSMAPKNSKDKRHQQLLFLETAAGKRSSFAPASPQEDDIKDHDTPHINQENDEDNDNSRSSEQEPEYMEANTIIKEEEITDNESDTKEYSTVLEKRKRLESWNEENETKKLKRIETRREDDVDLFCRHLAEVLRSLPPVYKAELKQHISVITSNYEVIAAKESFDNTNS